MQVYYNENDTRMCAWLRKLMADGLIPVGDVDERSIEVVKAAELIGYDQCHFFAGIGGWPYALELAGWGDRPVWTGSCPCQPFSQAGKRKGAKDSRHLWPAFRRLISERHPPAVFGEQVASKDGRNWLAGVRADLEALGYAVGGADLCAAGVGAPHIRQRLYWVADADGVRHERGYDRDETGAQCSAESRREREKPRVTDAPDDSPSCGLGDADKPRPQGHRPELSRRGDKQQPAESVRGAGFWSESFLWPCTDGRWRRIAARADKPAGCGGADTAPHALRQTLYPEPALFPLATGVSGRVGLLRGAGNAIVPEVAAQFIGAFLESEGRK